MPGKDFLRELQRAYQAAEAAKTKQAADTRKSDGLPSTPPQDFRGRNATPLEVDRVLHGQPARPERRSKKRGKSRRRHSA